MKRIPLEVSSVLGKISTDKPLEISPYANATGVTTEKAPVLIAVRSAATVTADEFALRMVKVGGQGTEAQARLALNAIAAVLCELIEEYGAITVNTPFGTIQTFISGTLENAQDTPDPETNRAFLGVVVPEVYRRQFAQMTAYIPTGACPVAVKRVRDKATNAKGICGTQPFYLEGRGMSFGGEGEKLELLDPLTRDKICDISVDAESKSPVQFLCTLSPQTAIEAGDYLVRLTTLAGGDTTLWPVDLPVELIEAIPAPLTPIYESSLGGIKVFAAKDSQGDELPDDGLNVPSTDDQLILEGEGLVQTDPEHPTTGINKVYFKSSDSAETCESTLTPMGDGKLALSLGMDSATLADGDYPNAKYVFFCYTDGESDSLEIPFALHKGE